MTRNAARGAPAPRFVSGSTMRHVSVMTATGAVGLMAVFLVDAANLFYISMLGAAELAAAIGFAGVAQFFTISVSIGFAIAGAALVSRAIGAGDRAAARRIAASALLIVTLGMTLVSGGVWIMRHQVVAALGAEGETARLAARFLSIALPSLPLMGVTMASGSFLRATAAARQAMNVTLVGGITAAALDPLFIFALGLGLDGAAMVTILSRAVSASVGLYFCIRHHDLIARPRLRDIRADAPALLGVALPAIATQLSTPTAMAILTRTVAVHGDAAVAGWAVVGRLSNIAFGGLYALSGAIGPIIGQNLGAGRVDRVKRAYRDALIFNIGYVLIAALTMLALRDVILDAFALTREGRRVAGAFLGWGSWFFVFTGALFVANAAFNNLGRPLWSTALNWSRDAALVPLMALLAPAALGAGGAVWAQATAGALAGAAGAVLAWFSIERLARRVLARRAPAPHPLPPYGSGRAALAAEAVEATEATEATEAALAPGRDDR